MPKLNSYKRTFKQKKSEIPRPLNSFMIFRMEHQASVGMEYPGATHQEISKKLSVKWRNLNSKEKKVYTNKAAVAKEEHKLLYPDYKYCPRRRNGSPRGVKKANDTKSIQVIDQSIPVFQHENYLTNSSNPEASNIFIPVTTTPHPLEIVNLTFDNMAMQSDPILINAPCYDNLLLCPTLNEPFNQGPSSSPAFSLLSPYSGVSPSISSEYDPTVLQLPELFEPFLGIRPYSCGQLDDFMSEPALYQCDLNVGYQQVDLSVPFNTCDMSSMSNFMPLSQFSLSETLQDHKLLSTVKNYTQTIEETIAQVLGSSPSFDTVTNTITPVTAPLLTQPFHFINF